jgi:hypothetical protein
VGHGQLVDDSAEKTVFDWLAELGIGFARGVEAVGVEVMEGEDADAYGAACLGETLAPGVDLEVGGNDDAGGVR